MPGFFSTCPVDDRFHILEVSRFGARDPAHKRMTVLDWDTRRYLVVEGPFRTKEDQPENVLKALREVIDGYPLDVVRFSLDLTRTGRDRVLETSNATIEDITEVPFYPSPAHFDASVFGAGAGLVHAVLRRSLVEVARMGPSVDRVTWETTAGSQRTTHTSAFKYYFVPERIAMVWHEINCHARIPHHPNVVPLEALVADHVAPSKDKVVGFLTPFVPGGTVHDRPDRPFKLKHLQQLLDVVDWLNHTLGICHGDVRPFNLLFDEKKDNVQLFDFNMASRVGDTAGFAHKFAYDPDRNDVKGAAFTMYEIITRDLSLREGQAPADYSFADILGNPRSKKPAPVWTKHPSVKLDADVQAYRAVIEQWVSKRAKMDKPANKYHHKTIKTAIGWPGVPPYPPVMWCGDLREVDHQSRAEMIDVLKEPFLRWERPPTARLPLPAGEVLLASGEVRRIGGVGSKREASASPERQTDGRRRPAPSVSTSTGSSAASATSVKTSEKEATGRKYALRSAEKKK